MPGIISGVTLPNISSSTTTTGVVTTTVAPTTTAPVPPVAGVPDLADTGPTRTGMAAALGAGLLLLGGAAFAVSAFVRLAPLLALAWRKFRRKDIVS